MKELIITLISYLILGLIMIFIITLITEKNCHARGKAHGVKSYYGIFSGCIYKPDFPNSFSDKNYRVM